MKERLSKKDLLIYGMQAMPLAFAGIPLYIHAPDFYATEFGLSLASLGLILLALRFLDAVQDPLIGYFSDRCAQHRPKIMFAGSVGLAVSFALLFKPLVDNYAMWFALFVLLATTAFSALTINLNTLGGLWSRDKNQKTTIAGYRESFGLLGLMCAVTLPSVLQNNMPKEEAFFFVSFFLLFIIILTGLFFVRWQKNHRHLNERNRANTRSWRQIKKISGETKKFFLVYGVSMLGSSIPAILVLFFIRDRLALENYTGLFLLFYFLSGAAGIPMWNHLSRTIGKHKTWLMAMLLATVSFVWAYFLGAGDFWFYLIICAMSGAAFGAELVLPASILADYIHETNNEETAAMHFGVLAFLAKGALALSAAATFPYLEGVGFVAGQSNDENALQALSLSYAALPCLIKLSAIYLLWRITNKGKGI